MERKACEDVLSVIRGSRDAIKGRQFAQLHSLSNRIIHCISVYQDKVLLDVAVAVYSLDKLLEDERFLKRKEMPEFIETVLLLLQDSALLMEKRKLKDFDKAIRDLLREIEKFSSKVKLYTQAVLDYARAKKGSKLYEHGLSLGTASQLTGASKWELMEAASESAVEDVMPIDKKRINLVMKLFKLGGTR